MPGGSKKRRRSHHSSFTTPQKWLVGVLTVAAVALVAALVSVALAPRSPSTDAGFTPHTGAYPWETTAAQEPMIAVIGDSYTAGSGIESSANALWVKQFEASKVYALQDLSHGGVGYVRSGDGGVNFGSGLQQIKADTELVVFIGSRNDADYPYEEIRAAAEADYSAVKAKAPSAKILVIGPIWVDSNVPEAISRDRDAVRDAATSVGATWVDPLLEGWFADRPDLIGSDGVHPTDEGQAYLLQKIGPLIQSQVGTP